MLQEGAGGLAGESQRRLEIGVQSDHSLGLSEKRRVQDVGLPAFKAGVLVSLPRSVLLWGISAPEAVCRLKGHDQTRRLTPAPWWAWSPGVLEEEDPQPPHTHWGARSPWSTLQEATSEQIVGRGQ